MSTVILAKQAPAFYIITHMLVEILKFTAVFCHRILIQITKRVQFCTFIIYIIKRIISYYASSEIGRNYACNVVKNKYHWFLFFEHKI